MAVVVATDEFSEWYLGLDQADASAVDRIVGLLEAKGIALGYPYSSDIKGGDGGLRELRVQSGGRPIRIFYAFDPRRQAVLLLGGNKEGNDRVCFWSRASDGSISKAYVEIRAG